MANKRFRGAYVTEWAKISYQVKKDASWRCVRCGHPNEGSGPHNRIPCDEHCDLDRHPESVDFPEVAGQILAYFALVGSPAFTAAGSPPAWPQQRQRVLTVHHFDGNKENNLWWNLMALCQVCHLVIQGKVVPEQPWMFEHSNWIKPYIAGYYAREFLELHVPRIFFERRPEWIDQLLDYPHLLGNSRKVALELSRML